MSELEQKNTINLEPHNYFIRYLHSNHETLSSNEARSITYLGHYDVDSKGNIMSFADTFAGRKYQTKSQTPTRTTLKYLSDLNPCSKSENYYSIIDFYMLQTLKHSIPYLLQSKRLKAEYNVFIDTKEDGLDIHHVVRIEKKIVCVFNADYEMVNIYYIDEFFKTYKDKDFEERQEFVSFFFLYFNDDNFKAILEDVDIYKLSIEQVRQYLQLKEIIEY